MRFAAVLPEAGVEPIGCAVWEEGFDAFFQFAAHSRLQRLLVSAFVLGDQVGGHFLQTLLDRQTAQPCPQPFQLLGRDLQLTEVNVLRLEEFCFHTLKKGVQFLHEINGRFVMDTLHSGCVVLCQKIRHLLCEGLELEFLAQQLLCHLLEAHFQNVFLAQLRQDVADVAAENLIR